MTQGKIERYHRTMKNVVKLKTYFLPWELEHEIEAFVDYYNNHRVHESLDNMTPADVFFDRHKEIQTAAVFIAKVCPNPRERSIGLRELMINAVEHGNLGITYDEKSHLNKHGIWKDEVTRRQQLSEYKDKAVTVDLRRTDKDVTITIADEGEGFDWTRYLEYDPERLFDSHGREIAMANAQSFDALEYQGKGNVVKAVIHLTERSVSNPFD